MAKCHTEHCSCKTQKKENLKNRNDMRAVSGETGQKPVFVDVSVLTSKVQIRRRKEHNVVMTNEP
jgi:hypothetical protein